MQLLMPFQYDPERPVDPEEWLAFDEQERIEVVRQYHRRKKFRLPNEELHAITHAVVESQIAFGEHPVRAALSRLIGEGLDRHEAVHAIGFVLAEYMNAVVKKHHVFATAEYMRDIERLSAESWRRNINYRGVA